MLNLKIADHIVLIPYGQRVTLVADLFDVASNGTVARSWMDDCRAKPTFASYEMHENASHERRLLFKSFLQTMMHELGIDLDAVPENLACHISRQCGPHDDLNVA